MCVVVLIITNRCMYCMEFNVWYELLKWTMRMDVLSEELNIIYIYMVVSKLFQFISTLKFTAINMQHNTYILFLVDVMAETMQWQVELKLICNTMISYSCLPLDNHTFWNLGSKHWATVEIIYTKAVLNVSNNIIWCLWFAVLVLRDQLDWKIIYLWFT
jgi:hypothetical protein